MKIELTEQEGNTLLVMIDEAVKAKGLIYAEAGVYFKKKLEQAFKEKNEPAPVQS